MNKRSKTGAFWKHGLCPTTGNFAQAPDRMAEKTRSVRRLTVPQEACPYIFTPRLEFVLTALRSTDTDPP